MMVIERRVKSKANSLVSQKEKQTKSRPPADQYGPEFGWKTLPSLAIGYVGLKKDSPKPAGLNIEATCERI